MSGIELILAERRRQVEEEGWTAEHDAKETPQHLEQAAHCYRDCEGPGVPAPAIWPWHPTYWKPKDRLRNLIRAGALYLAAADRAKISDPKLDPIYRNNALKCAQYIDAFQASKN